MKSQLMTQKNVFENLGPLEALMTDFRFLDQRHLHVSQSLDAASCWLSKQWFCFKSECLTFMSISLFLESQVLANSNSLFAFCWRCTISNMWRYATGSSHSAACVDFYFQFFVASFRINCAFVVCTIATNIFWIVLLYL